MTTALITGASSGIGECLAEQCAKHKIDLVLTARSEDKLQALSERLVSQYGVQCHVITSDLSAVDGVQKLVDELDKLNCQVDYLINNAGFGDFGFFVDSDLAKQKQMMMLNMVALTELTHRLLPAMKARGNGKILNVASTASFMPGPYMSVYYATKAYVLSFSEAIANELQGTGVTVTALCPGPTASGFQDAAEMNKSGLVKMLPMPTSEQVAEYGFNAMMKGKRVAIHGAMNWLMAQSIRFTPRRIATAVVRMISSPKG
ncbi:SDR family oxidoreductase [Paraneptunicella aestuarii]|uniref:SDR family NAD(P)-dependent oxidoreductase n=1 Tax=Paraneptunicella aestuarii TaxID=2831148 RepID=UPI001E2CF524|nr:SDR family oxidoreductase [Paraneptunicella aestuarii]UAA37752.1 SDR family oxidoreductase [Paraneptunicella aestuarii]